MEKKDPDSLVPTEKDDTGEPSIPSVYSRIPELPKIPLFQSGWPHADLSRPLGRKRRKPPQDKQRALTLQREISNPDDIVFNSADSEEHNAGASSHFSALHKTPGFSLHHWPHGQLYVHGHAQHQKVERVTTLLLETFNDLSYEELKTFRWLLQFTCFHKNLPLIPWSELQTVGWYHGAKMERMVNLLMETYGQHCVEVIMSVFMNMNRTDLVQKLSDTSSAPEAAGSSPDPHGAEMMETESLDTRWPQLSQKVDEMMSVAESLVEVLTRLDLKRFIETLQRESEFYRWCSNIPLYVSEITELPDVLLLMVQSGCQQFVKMTEEILKKMDRTDLVPMLSVNSSEPKKEHLGADELLFAATRKVATMAAVKQLLLETLKDLTDEEHKKFKMLLQSVAFRRKLPDISMLSYNMWYVAITERKEETVEQMVHTFGQQCLQIMGEIFMNMKRPDVVQRLPVSSTALKGKRFVEEQQLEKAAVQQILVEKLNGLSYLELEKFKWLLQFTCFRKSLPQVDRWYLNRTDRAELVNLMTDTWGHQSLEVVDEVLMDMNRTDLGETVSEKVKHQRSLLQNEICNKEELQLDSRKWTLLKPEVESRDVKEASTYM